MIILENSRGLRKWRLNASTGTVASPNRRLYYFNVSSFVQNEDKTCVLFLSYYRSLNVGVN